MKQLLVFLSVTVGVTLAGVGHLSPEEEQLKWSQFSRLCLSGQTGEYGQDLGGNRVFCKQAPFRIRQDNNHEVSKDFGGAGQQEVFVQPPPLELNHRVLVRTRFDGGRTKVYVVPNTVDNRYEVDVRGEGGNAEKPSVYYLKHGQTPSIPPPVGDRPVYGPPQPIPGPDYGVPPKQGYA